MDKHLWWKDVSVSRALLALCAVLASCAFGESEEEDVGHAASELVIDEPEPTSSAGTMPGSLDVDANGQFRYRIPIEVPPGRNGVEPGLAFEYTSDQSESSLGVGFDISGFSTITRCPRSLGRDGVRRPVRIDWDDALCLDGQRLVADPSTPAPGPRVYYRTERDSLKRILALSDHTTGVAGVTHFIVELPDGSKQFYGSSINSQQRVARDGYTFVVSWHLDEYRDSNGNVIRYTYDHVVPTPPPNVGEREPLELLQPRGISYTGYYDGTRVHGGTRSVTFEYMDPILDGDHHGEIDPNPEGRSGWFLGHFYYGPSMRRLARVKTWVEDTLVREYRVHGSHDPVSHRWRVDYIETCATAPADHGDETDDGMVCLSPHRFTWNEPGGFEADELDPTYEQPTFFTYQFEWPNRKDTWQGLCDDQVSQCIERNPVHILDMNGDGTDDLVYLVEDEGTRWRLAVRFGTHFAQERDAYAGSGLYATEHLTSVVGAFPLNGYTTIDYDWDGKDDIMYVDLEGQTTVLRSTGTDFVALTAGLPTFDVEPFEEGTSRWQYFDHVNFDVNGDGRTDILACQTDRHGAGTGIYSAAPDDHEYNRRATWHVSLRTDTGFGPVTDTGIATNCWVEVVDNRSNELQWDRLSPGKVVGDYDGDGVAEMLIAPDLWGEDGATAHYPRVLRWNHDRGAVEALDTNLNLYDDYGSLQRPHPVDLNGDGLHDLVGLDQADAEYDPERVHYRVMSLGEPAVFADHNPGAPAPDTRLLAPADFGAGAYSITRIANTGSGPYYVHSIMAAQALDLNADGRGDLMMQTLPGGSGALPSAIGWDTYQWDDSRLWSLETRNGYDTRIYETLPRIRGPRVSGGSTGHTYFSPIVRRLDANGDGAMDLIEYIDVSDAYALPNPAVRVHLNMRARPTVVTMVRNGIGREDQVEYTTLADPDVYQQGTTHCAYPIRCVSDSRMVVKELRLDDGRGEYRALQYTYEDGKTDVLGFGWLGFRSRTVVDTSTGELTRAIYDNHTFDVTRRVYPYAGMVRQEIVSRSTDAMAGMEPSLRAMGSTVTHYYRTVDGTIPGTYRVEEIETVSREFRGMLPPGPSGPLDGVPMVSRETTTRDFDGFGNVVEETTTFDGTDIVAHSTARYGNNPTSWRLGFLEASESTTSENGCTFTTSQEMHYLADRPLVAEVIQEPGHPDAEVTTSFRYDVYGNPIRMVSRASGLPDRTTEVAHDSEGYFAETVANALGHTSHVIRSARHGGIIERTDPNGTRTTHAYDGFGRARVTDGDGLARVETMYGHGTLSGSALLVSQLSETGTMEAIDLDTLGRAIAERWRNGPNTYERRTEYDGRGNVASVSAPFRTWPTAEPIRGYTTMVTDDLGMLRRSETPDGEVTHHWYRAREVHSRDGEGNEWVKRSDDVGRMARVEEPAPGGHSRYEYCGGTALRRVLDGPGNETKLEYDSLGRRIGLDEPNRGLTTYQYTAYDQMRLLTDAAGRQTAFHYDELGRLTEREDRADGTSTLFEYDTARDPRGRPVLGALHRAIGAGGDIVDEVEYDEIGRVAAHVRMAHGHTLRTRYTYDGHGRLESLTYPTTLPGDPLKVSFRYGVRGSVERIDADANPVWTLIEPSAHGLPARAEYGHGMRLNRGFTAGGKLAWIDASGTVAGSGRSALGIEYDYDGRGLMSRRYDYLLGRMDTYEYDEVARLTTVSSTDPRFDQSYEYDVLGNLVDAHDVGALDYGGLRAPLPHAVKKVGGVEYAYDAVGNLEKRGDTQIVYNQLNLPRVIGSPSAGNVTYSYSADGLRGIRKDERGSTLYVPGLYERVEDSGDVRETYYVAGPGGAFLQINREATSSGGTMDTHQYLHRDALGSVTGISQPDGRVFFTQYDAFGKILDTSAPDSVTRGFTGHEHEIDDLINMNGRLYDAVARRFVSPDPFVSSPGLQSLNRYSYVLNSPVNGTDPSGYRTTPIVTVGSGARVALPAGYMYDEQTDTVIAKPIYVSDSSESERGGAGSAGQSTNAGKILGDPRGRPRPLLSDWRPPRPLATGDVPLDWGIMMERAEPTMTVTYYWSHGAAWVGGVGAAAGALGAPAIAAGYAAYMEAGYVLAGLAARYRAVGMALSAATSIVNGLNDGHVPLPTGAAEREALRAACQANELARRAAEIHARNASHGRTIAVVDFIEDVDGEQVLRRVVGINSSTGGLSGAQRAALRPGEIIAEFADEIGPGFTREERMMAMREHAEVNAIWHGLRRGWTPVAAGASRDFCAGQCSQLLPYVGFRLTSMTSAVYDGISRGVLPDGWSVVGP